MKHVVLAVVGSIFSFIASIVWSPFANFFLSKDLHPTSYTLLPRVEYQNVLGFLLAPCLMLAISIVAGNQCANDKERKLLNFLFTTGCFAALVWINVYAFNKMLYMPSEVPIASLIVIIAIKILHFGFALLFFALSKLAIQAGIYASSPEYSINKFALWSSIVGSVVLLPFLLFFTTPDRGNSFQSVTRPDTPEVIAQAVTPTVAMYERWSTQSDSSKHYIYTLQHTKNHCLAEYTKETSPNGEPLCLWRKVYDKNKKLIAEDKYTVPMLKTVLPNIKNLRNRGVAEQIMRYSRKEISQKELVEWAHYVLLDGSVSESSSDNIMYAVGRIGLADVPEFGLPENMIEDLIGRLALSAQ